MPMQHAIPSDAGHTRSRVLGCGHTQQQDAHLSALQDTEVAELQRACPAHQWLVPELPRSPRSRALAGPPAALQDGGTHPGRGWTNKLQRTPWLVRPRAYDYEHPNMWVLLHVVFARHAWQQSGSQGIQGLRRDSWRRRLGRLFRANPVQPEFTTVVSAEGGVED